MEDLMLTYNNSIQEMEVITKQIKTDLGFSFEEWDFEKSESSLDAVDYCFTFLFGLLGAFLSTSKKFEKFLAGIHKSASEVPGDYNKIQVMIGNLVHHKKDNIDKMVFRDFTNVDRRFHRLFWGHDIFSTGPDNPFVLMVNQKGSLIKGVLQAFRHLLGDTMSKQGLPMPGSSFFDYTNENGKMRNYIVDICENLSEEAYGHQSAQKIYEHLFTIRAQDITGGFLVKTLTEVYFKIRKIDDKLRKTQIAFMSYAVNFFTEAIIGMVRQKGIPYINIPVGSAMLVAFAKFCYLDHKEIDKLIKRTNELVEINDEIIMKYELHNELLNTNNSVEEIIDDLERSEDNMDELIDFLKGDNK